VSCIGAAPGSLLATTTETLGVLPEGVAVTSELPPTGKEEEEAAEEEAAAAALTAYVLAGGAGEKGEGVVIGCKDIQGSEKFTARGRCDNSVTTAFYTNKEGQVKSKENIVKRIACSITS
jgi:hypothetical protein